MNINTNIGLRDRSKITLTGFKGLDTLSASVDVSAIHATEMKNLISRDGVNHKRFGWKTQLRIRDNGKYLKIQGFFSFTLFHEKFFIVYAGKKFWSVDTLNNYQDITENGKTIAVVDKTLLTDTECKCYINGNKAYFIGCGDFLVFSKWNNDKFELRRVVGNEDVYIPTTTENIGSEEDGQHYTRITAEEKNILSPYTYNLLFGVEGLKSGSVANYYLDCNDFTDIEVSVERQGEETIILTKSTGTGVYNVGDKIKNTEFTLPNIVKSNTTSGTVKETAIPHTTTITNEVDYTRRWFTEYDTYKANKAFGFSCYPYLSTGSERGRACNATNPKTGQPFGTYQNYMDYVFEKYMGYAPDLTYTAEAVTTTHTTYTYEYSCEISIGITSLITLITMENGDKLAIRNTVKTYSASTLYGTVENTEVYYKKPEKISFSLVYIKANGSETVLRTVGEKNVSCSITSVAKNSITADITYSYGTLSCDLTNYNAEISSFLYGQGLFKNSEALTLKDSTGKYTGQVSVSEMKLTLNSVSDNESAYAPLVPDVPNIKVKLTRPFDASIVTSAIKACEFGAQGGTDRLFIVDNTGNTVRWSKDEDFTYFGEKSWCVCGTSDKSITGMDRLNDSTLLIVKEYSPREPSIFIITGNIMTGKTEAGTVDYTALFTPHGYQVGMGAVGEIVNFNGDCLMVGKDGLYAVSLGENMTVDSRYVLHRSRQISNKLEKFDLANAKCVSFNGKFFVAVGGENKECYVADNKYTASFEGDIQNVVNYEWWRWTNIPVNVWGFVDNELWFGTEDGQLCSFTNNFNDETFSRLYTGLIDYEIEDNEIVGFVLNSDIKVKIGDVFTPTCDFYGGVSTNKFECVGEETRFYLPLKDFADNETVYIDNTPYQITKHDLYFSIAFKTDLTELTIYKNYKNKPLTVMDEVAIVLKDRDGKFPKWSGVTANGGLNPAITNFSATLSHKEAVISKWVSGAMDLGTRIYSKSLTYLVLTGEKDLANRLKYGLKTRFTHRDYELLRANNDLDFNELDLETVSMDSDFASSYIKRLNIRNVNFLMFYFISDTAEDIALNSIQIEFKLHKRNIGVK